MSKINGPRCDLATDTVLASAMTRCPVTWKDLYDSYIAVPLYSEAQDHQLHPPKACLLPGQLTCCRACVGTNRSEPGPDPAHTCSERAYGIREEDRSQGRLRDPGLLL